VSSSTTESDPETAARADLERIFRAAIDAVDPARLVGRAMDGESEQIPDLIANASRVFLLAVGKAAASMAAEIERRIGAKIIDAIAVMPKSAPTATSPTSKVRRFPSAHPIPDDSSEAAARAACEMLRALSPDDLLIVALSGGASAMFTMPAETIPLADKIAINQALLKAGASIRELNVVRKHLSAVKGGRLLHRCGRARVLGLILSDVPGNDLATIGSGLTTADWSSFGDAVAVLKRRNVWGRAPESARAYLERAVAGEFADTIKSNDPVLERVTNVIVGDNDLALAGADRAAAALGYRPERWKELHGEANDVGRALAEYLCEVTDERVCVIAGGEPVVTVRGGGRGGRAQQCALAMNIELARIGASRRIAALFAGTDGIDGPTDAAGGFVSPAIVERGRRAGLSAEMAATRNDSYNFLKATDGLFAPGATGTNVSDIFIGLVNY
jgi:glycerate 2-kinase